jgi:hypothetical protein
MTNTNTNPTAAEALGEKIPFSFGGVDYLIATTAEWPFEALEAFEEGKIATFLRLILGDEQLAAFKSTRPTVATTGELSQAIQKAVGVSGN